MDADSRGGTPTRGDVLAAAEAPMQQARPALPVLACPNLCLANDPVTFALFPTPEHRCLARSNFQPSQARQSRHCLGSYLECTEFKQTSCSETGQPRRTSWLTRLKLPIAGLAGVALGFAAASMAAALRLAA